MILSYRAFPISFIWFSLLLLTNHNGLAYWQKTPQTPAYEIVQIWPQANKRSEKVLLFGFLSNRNLTTEELKRLAAVLKKRYSKYKTISVALWDNKSDAEYFGSMRIDDYTGFNKNLVVEYHYKKDTGTEFMKYISDNSKSAKAEIITIK